MFNKGKSSLPRRRKRLLRDLGLHGRHVSRLSREYSCIQRNVSPTFSLIQTKNPHFHSNNPPKCIYSANISSPLPPSGRKFRISLGIVALMATYAISIGCMLWRRIRIPESLPPTKWSLGKAGIVVNGIGLTYSIYAFFWAFWPIYWNPSPVEVS